MGPFIFCCIFFGLVAFGLFSQSRKEKREVDSLLRQYGMAEVEGDDKTRLLKKLNRFQIYRGKGGLRQAWKRKEDWGDRYLFAFGVDDPHGQGELGRWAVIYRYEGVRLPDFRVTPRNQWKRVISSLRKEPEENAGFLNRYELEFSDPTLQDQYFTHAVLAWFSANPGWEVEAHNEVLLIGNHTSEYQARGHSGLLFRAGIVEEQFRPAIFTEKTPANE